MGTGYATKIQKGKNDVIPFKGCLVQVGNGIDLEAVGLQFEPYLWRPCGVTWDSSRTVVVIKLRRTSALKDYLVKDVIWKILFIGQYIITFLLKRMSYKIFSCSITIFIHHWHGLHVFRGDK